MLSWRKSAFQSSGLGKDKEGPEGAVELRKRGFKLYREAISLAKSREYDAAAARLDEAATAWHGLPSPLKYEFLLCVGNAQVLSGRHRWSDALESIDRAIALRERAPDLPEMTAGMLGTRATLLDVLRRREEAFTAADVAINAAARESEDERLRVTTEMLLLQGNISQQERKHEAAVAKYQAALEISSGTDGDPVLIASAMSQRAVSLEHLKRMREALEATDAFLAAFADADNREIRTAVRSARVRRALLAKLVARDIDHR